MPIAVFYIFYFSAVGVLIPYLPPYFRSLGLSGAEIGALTSIAPLLMVFVPPVWGYLADRTRRTALLLKLATLGAGLAFTPLVGVTAFWAIAAILVLHALFFTPITTLADTVAVAEARRRGTEFARLRLWGSLGFIVSTFLFSLHLEAGGEPGHAVYAIAALLLFAALASLSVPAAPRAGRPPSLRAAARLVADPRLFFFLIAGALHWASAAPYHILFAVHLEDLGVLPRYVGIGLAIAVTAEVVTMWAFPAIRRRFSLPLLLGVAFVATAARWGITAVATTGLALAAAQVLHAFTFGLFYVASIATLEREVPGELAGTGRALFSAVALGVGGAGGNALAGGLYDQGGGELAFLVGAVLSLTALVFVALSAARPRARSRALP